MESKFSIIILICSVATVRHIEAHTTASICTSTGHRCITTDQCSGLIDGQYQWCGGCQNHVRCLAGVGELFTYTFQPFTQWDDNKKNYEFASTTCVECYYTCPPGPSAPTNPSGPLCGRTGLGCLNDTCPGGASGNFQYCVDCSNYVTCSLTGGYSLNTCGTGTFYDDFSRICVTSSTTCRECYDTCVETTTVPPTTTVTTTQSTTTTMPTTTTTPTTTTERTTTVVTTTQGTIDSTTTRRLPGQTTDDGTPGVEGTTADSDSSTTAEAKAAAVTSSFIIIASLLSFLCAAI